MTSLIEEPESVERPPFRIGGLTIDDVTFAEALSAIESLVRAGEGGTVLTPNIDHVVLAQHDPALRAAYEAASLSLVDGTPLLWISRLLGPKLREKVSGSDLVVPLLRLAEQRGFRVYFFGGAPGVAERAADVLRRDMPSLRIVGMSAPDIDLARASHPDSDVLAPVKAANPDLVFVALGCPKQEIFMHAAAPALRPAVLLGIGASLDFVAGTVHRAPPWVSAAGLEWLYRLAREPRRLWRRYLVRDPEMLAIVAREIIARNKLFGGRPEHAGPSSDREGNGPPHTPPHAGAGRVCILGDSLPANLSTLLHVPGVAIETRGVLSSPPGRVSLTGEPEEPPHVFVAFSPPDLLRARHDPARVVAQAHALLDSLVEKHSRAAVTVCSIPPTTSDHPRLNSGIVTVNRALLALTEERGLGWIDLHGMLRDDTAPHPAIAPRYAGDGFDLRGPAYRLFRDAIAAEIGRPTPRLIEDAALDAGALVRETVIHTLDHARAGDLDPARDRVALLFFGDVERDTLVRGDREVRKFARRVRHALTHRQHISGFTVAFQALCRALSRAGFRVVLNDAELARRNPHYPIGVAGYPHILDRWSLPNPTVLGPGLFDHPGQAPRLPEDPRFKAYLVPEGWMTDLFRGAWGDLCMPWHAGIDLGAWPSFRAAPKDIDVLVYAKFLWDPEACERTLLAPLLASLKRRHLRAEVLRYGAYEPGEYRALLRRSRAMVYLCQHETQGIACAEAMACDVPILAWDQGEWLDPTRFRYGTPRVPASSVPYFDATCGVRFARPEDLEDALDRFLAGAPGFAPRAFVARRLSLQASADLYEAALRRAAGSRSIALAGEEPLWPS
ncbi:MAG: WecB/TagA/CpsF family glycosyltransferase [Polyangiaceae bacterium]